jgi:hypothetical protein
MNSPTRYVLRSRIADSLPLYFGETGPTTERANAIEYEGAEVERRRATAAFVFDLAVEAVEVDNARRSTVKKP